MPGKSCPPGRGWLGLCFLLVAILTLPAVPERAGAAPARPALELVHQPDGTPIWLQQVGDEHGNGLRTHDGYTIVPDQATGFWHYAEPAPGGGLQPSSAVVGHHPPAVPKRLPVPKRRLAAGPAAASGPDGAASGPAPAPLPAGAQAATANLGSQPVLVLFADFTPSARVGSTGASLAGKFFGLSGSVKDYYEEVSYGLFTLAPATESNASLSGALDDGVVSVTLAYPHPNTGAAIDDRNRSITRDALIAANAFVNFAAFDGDGDGVISATELHVVVIVAGYERSFSAFPCGPSVWGHRWGLGGTVPAPVLDGKVVGATYAQFGEWHCASGSPPGHAATIGIMAHELGHDLGLPDLYDTDGSSEGIGAWGVMGGGSWNQASLPGDSPAHMDPWSKLFEGWIAPRLVTGTLVDEPIDQAATSPAVYQLLAGTATSGEYFLVENRQKVGYDAGLPGAGLLIWHVDASRTSNTAECFPGGPSCAVSHYLLAVMQADGLFDLEKGNDQGDPGDPWPGSTGNPTFGATSTPSSRLYDGRASNVTVTGISPSGPTIFATLSAEPPVPDLVMAAVSAPAVAAPGQTISVTTTATNQGAGAAGAFRVGIYLSATDPSPGAGSLLGFRDVTSLAGGASSTATTVVAIAAGTALGTYYLSARADTGGSVAESDETNNGRTAASQLTVTRPELSVSAVSGPSVGSPGHTVTVTTTVANTGAVSSGSFRVGIYLSADPAFDGADRFLGSRTVAALAGGATSTAATTATIPADVPFGPYHLIAVADDLAGVTELDETNNARATAGAMTLTEFLPDLVMVSVSAPSTGFAGQKLAVRTTVSNAGPAAAGPFTVGIYLGAEGAPPGAGSLLASRALTGLVAGATWSATTKVTLPSATGSYSLSAVADVGSVVTELGEANNGLTAASALSVQPFLPDLAVTAVSAATTVGAGQALSVRTTVRNLGPVAAGTFRLGIYMSASDPTPGAGDLVGSRVLTGLASGGSVSPTTSVTVPAAFAGLYYLSAKADVDAAVAEADETNNGATASGQVQVTGSTSP